MLTPKTWVSAASGYVLLEAAHFFRSIRRESPDIESHSYVLLPFVIMQRMGLPVLVYQSEIWSQVTQNQQGVDSYEPEGRSCSNLAGRSYRQDVLLGRTMWV